MDEAKKLGYDIASAEKAAITASITADYGDKSYIFCLKMLTEGDTWSIEVLEPDNIRGITARCQAGSRTMEFDGVILDTGEFESTDITPINALPVMLSAWRDSHISEVLSEGADALWVSYSVSDFTVVRTLFDTQSHLPVRAYIEAEGTTVITAEFQNIVTDEHVLMSQPYNVIGHALVICNV